MATQNLILSSLELEDLQQMITDAVEDAMKQHEVKKAEQEDEELLTRQEVANIYKTSLVTLRQWERDEIIPKPIRKGTRVYFRKSEIFDDIRSTSKN